MNNLNKLGMKKTLRILVATSLCVFLASCSRNYRVETSLINGGEVWTLSTVLIPANAEFNHFANYETNKYLSFRYSDSFSMINHGNLILEICDNNRHIERWNWDVNNDGTNIHLTQGDFVSKNYKIASLTESELVLIEGDSSSLIPPIKYKYTNKYDNVSVQYIRY